MFSSFDGESYAYNVTDGVVGHSFGDNDNTGDDDGATKIKNTSTTEYKLTVN